MKFTIMPKSCFLTLFNNTVFVSSRWHLTFSLMCNEYYTSYNGVTSIEQSVPRLESQTDSHIKQQQTSIFLQHKTLWRCLSQCNLREPSQLHDDTFPYQWQTQQSTELLRRSLNSGWCTFLYSLLSPPGRPNSTRIWLGRMKNSGTKKTNDLDP